MTSTNWRALFTDRKITWAVVLVFLFSRFWHLDILPIFADEAIYIRWAQLILHDRAYLFFALNDGKPPLFIWSLLPVLSTNLDPLWGARAVSGLFGLGQLLVIDGILREFRAGRLSRLIGAVVVTLAPFWFFHHRMALMDGLLTLALSLSWWGMLRLSREVGEKRSSLPTVATSILMAGLGWGIGLWTKTPALFFAPVFLLWAYGHLWLWRPRLHWVALGRRTVVFGLAGTVGLGVFALLRVSPAFGSLLGRSTDFTFSIAELQAGEWRVALNNLPRLLSWLSTYLRPELLSLPFIALAISRHRMRHWRILLSALIWAAPLIIFGRVLHPRYFLPMAPFITVSAALFFREVWDLLQRQRDSLYPWLVFWLLTFFFLVGSLRFDLLAFFTPNQIPFVPDDRVQYLTEWSSGHGLVEVRNMILAEIHRGNRVTVVTEGSFGSLPDGLLLYFDRRPEIKHLRLDGLAQYPVTSIPDWVYQDAADHPTWLVVNEHRVGLDPATAGLELLARFPRPYGAPELHVYSVRPE